MEKYIKELNLQPLTTKELLQSNGGGPAFEWMGKVANVIVSGMKALRESAGEGGFAMAKVGYN
ncbi:MAG: hypothetical protein ACK5KP_12925 [Paludibacteraceae bacterium]